MLHFSTVSGSVPVIGIDCRFAETHSGLGTYTRSMVQALMRRKDSSSYILFVRSMAEPWVSDFALNDNVSFRVASFAHYSFREQWDFPILIRESGCDLFYSPHFNVPYLCDTPFVCTVHDLILHRFPNQANILKRLAYKLLVGRAIKKAKAIVCVSEATQIAIDDYYPGIVQKTEVIYPGVGKEFRPADSAVIEVVRKKYSLARPFLLYIGNCKQHKNVPMLIESFRVARLQNTELILVSGGSECSSLQLPSNVRRIESVAESDLPALYSAAAGCVTASLLEGFGMPMIEAMACGCPVMATNTGSLPEICDTHALIVEPTIASLSEGMKKLVHDEKYRSRDWLDAAKQWAGHFDWDEGAGALVEVLQKAFLS